MQCRVFNRNNLSWHKEELFNGGYYFAEIIQVKSGRTFFTLCKEGKLKDGQKLKITYKGKSIIATKNSNYPYNKGDCQIMLHIVAAKALRFDFSKEINTVTVEIV